MKKGLFISLEGCSGVGKTYTASQFKNNNDIVVVSEVSQCNNSFNNKVVEIVQQINPTKDIFFLNAEPYTAFALLLSTYIYSYKTIIIPALSEGKIVISDRGIDSLALLQAILISTADKSNALQTYEKLLSLILDFCFLPDYTLILNDNFNDCILRLTEREKINLTERERQFLLDSYNLYHSILGDDRIKHVRNQDAVCYIEQIIYGKGITMDNFNLL
mgnify:CR=1 FL=1